jgi:5-methylthioadenosine/S-adenosylhomocysteine deaminase
MNFNSKKNYTNQNPHTLGIRCGILLSMEENETHDLEIIHDGYIGIHENTIVEVSKFDINQHKPQKLIDASNKLVMPGLINAHTHLPMSLFRGLSDDLPLKDWLFKVMLPLESKLCNPEFIKWGTKLSLLEIIRTGTTTICDMYYFEDIIAKVCDEAQIRMLAGQAIIDFPAPDKKTNPNEEWERLNFLVKNYKNHTRIIPCIAPHAPYSVSNETLKKVKDFSKQNNDIPVIIHVSETKQEVENSLKEFNLTPVQRLHSLKLCSKNSIFVHGVHLTNEDIEILKQTDTALIYNPESNMKLGSGIAPIASLLKNKIRLGLGTDGSASNNNLNLFTEMDSAAKLQKVLQADPSIIKAKDILKLATIDGARALNIHDLTGSIKEGKRADIIIIDLNHPHLKPIHEIESLIVYSMTGLEVQTVICDGKILFHENQYTTLNQEEIFEKVTYYQEIIQKELKNVV